MHNIILQMVRRDSPDLSARQLAVLLTCYTRDDVNTVRGLAALLNVPKPAVTRALDRLVEFDLASRKADEMDRRSVFVQHTFKGASFLSDLRHIMTEAAGNLP